MKHRMIYLLTALVLLSFVLIPLSILAETSSNPIGDTIDKTPSVKAMQSQPARGLSYTVDVLGNKVPTQTDNSGKHFMGR